MNSFLVCKAKIGFEAFAKTMNFRPSE